MNNRPADTDTELVALIAQLRTLQDTLQELEVQQEIVRELLAKTQARFDEARQKTELQRRPAI